MDVDPFKNLLTGFSKVSSCHFHVCIGDRVHFSTHKNGTGIHATEQILSLSERIISKGVFQLEGSKTPARLFGVPIQSEGKAIGSLVARLSDTDTIAAKSNFPQDMERFLTDLTVHMENHWDAQQDVEEVTDELTQSFEDLNLYSRIATQIKSLRFSSDMLQHLTKELLGTMRTDLAFVLFLNETENNTVVYEEALFKQTADASHLAEKLIRTVQAYFDSQEIDYYIVNDSKQNDAFLKLHTDPYRFLAVKITHGDTVYGWLGLLSFNMDEIFRQSELNLMRSMAEQLAMVLANTKLYNDLEKFVINVVKSLVYAIEAKDVYTRGHSERVNKYSMRLADRLELDEENKAIVHWASILHDVGKIGIPETILNKPGVLNDHEYEIIKNHPQKGYDILKPLDQLSDSLPGILHHHERYDGTGYPLGLKGKDIPLQARIIAIADTFDAITSDRAYRKAKSPRTCLKIMKSVAGTQLDPALFEIFLTVILGNTESGNRKETQWQH